MVQWYKNTVRLTEWRRSLRLNQTKSEFVLWQELRARRMGYKFYRQYTLGGYIVDFYCDECNLIIELDGPIHDSDQAKRYDQKRESWLVSQGYEMLRFKNDEVLFHRDIALDKIQKACERLFQVNR